jgi:glutaredoxin
MNLPWLSLTLLGIGSVISLICGILVLYVAFQKNPLWVLGCIFIPFCSLIFLIMYWADVKSAFLGQLLGLAVILAGLLTTPKFSASFWKGYDAAVALRSRKPAPSEDPNAQIQKHREQLESLQAIFAQDGVELTKQYQALDAQRKALKPEDTAAITKFNEAAAAYQAKNAGRKQMQAQIDSTQKELEGLLDTRARQAPTAATSNKRVVMYGTNHCPACEMARQYFVKNSVHYEEINVEGNRTGYEEFKKLGGSGVPLILVGDKKIEGFSANALDAALR